MTKTNQIASMAAAAGITNAQAHAAYTALTSVIAAAMHAGQRIHIDHVGTFTVRARAARTGRNPQTGETLAIPAGKTVHFSPAKELKAVL